MLFEDTYKTISNRSMGELKDKGSRFVAIALPVSSEDEVKKQISGIRAEYHDARHHCFAYVIGPDKSAIRYNDDGEPSGTAGRPILGQIHSKDLTDILVIVIRYFGGTKLGVRGLINAYKGSTAVALNNAKIITKTIDEIYALEFNYKELNQVMTIVKEENLNISYQRFNVHCDLVFNVRKMNAARVYSKLSKIEGLSIRNL